MSMTAAAAPTHVPAGRAPDQVAARPHLDDGSFGPGAERHEPPSGFRAALVLAVLLTVPAVYLVGRGELSVHDALVRFGCAWAFAAGGVALFLSTVGERSVSRASESSPTAEARAGARPGEDPAPSVGDGSDALEGRGPAYPPSAFSTSPS